MNQQLQFGYYPDRLDLSSGPIAISSLPDREATKPEVQGDEGVDGDWIYAPPQMVRDPLAELPGDPEHRTADFHQTSW